MNKRIQELAKEAGLSLSVDQQVAFQRAAKLIVRECARVVIQKQTENDIDGVVSKNPARDFAYVLIEHFGDKE